VNESGARWTENSLTSTVVSSEWTAVWWVAAALAATLVLIAVWVWRKGRPFAVGDVFRASRLSSGNHIFPTQVLIAPTSVVQYTPQWLGRREESIHMAHVSSVAIDTGVMFSDVRIETSGGSDPIQCHGHRKGDAVKMKTLIERYQTDYYRGAPPVPGRPTAGHP
jgi:hypothetical protein